MPVSFGHFFRGLHRPLRLRPLRLGQEWEFEVRPLSLMPQPSKLIQIKIRYQNPPTAYGAQDKLPSSHFPSAVS
jgi:hypothetical protein